MDVSVGHLNNRLALRLPAQLPLGLVFVLGRVEQFVDGDDVRSTRKQFDLVEKSYQVRCVLSERVLLDTELQEGSTIRAGGHLIFDPTRADYYLLVRDVEIVQVSPVVPKVPQADMTIMMQDVQKQAEAAGLAQSDLPSWVKKLAPGVYDESLVEVDTDDVSFSSNGDDVERQQLAQLSAAMDSNEDVELTSNLLEVAKKLNQARGVQVANEDSLGVQPPTMESRYVYPTDVEDPDAFVPTGKITSDRLLVLIIITALLLFLMIILVLYIRGL